MLSFPRQISFTLTNACNLRCAMCGQWSPGGYMRNKGHAPSPAMAFDDWKRLIDQIAEHSGTAILLRGGEPFLFPHIMELLEHIASRQLFTAIDTNGTLLHKYAPELMRFEKLHLTISIDGPEPIHDKVRGAGGTFQKIRQGCLLLHELELQAGRQISKSLNFTIMPDSVAGLSQMPDVARSLFIDTIAIVPYYYVTAELGVEYDRLLKMHFGCPAYSWQGFHHEHSGVDTQIFHEQHRQYLANLRDIVNFPYMDFSPQEYETWFTDPCAVVGSPDCRNIDCLLDIQPSGEANFCIDFPDVSIGNAKTATIEAIWNGPAAQRFRQFRKQQPLPVCHRCGAKYMALL
ncbi:MAG: radical SAM protein [Planctomycetaceae bacterium]|nr:radical SAM protein [Planctomycetaceae bacterium]